jgi:hypothetical protein
MLIPHNVGMDSAIFLVLTITSLAWLSGLTFLWFKLRRRYGKIFESNNNEDFGKVLTDLQASSNQRQQKINALQEALGQLKAESANHLQKTGLVRYNPFSDTGGNQSFALALLDEKGTGFVITSLHSREATRLFAKPVKEWKEVGYEFSKEEIQAVLEARKK